MALKALVVNDNEMSLEILEYILESNGYHITKVTNGKQAIRKLNAENFDLVFTVCWFNGDWSFSAFELTYSNGRKLHGNKKITALRKSLRWTPESRQ